ncbi:YggW family oxidoreductase, partial [Rubrivivax gelatinosus]|nr:YggW family oxidoreductase [Rubrivivax gelatinosus]
FAQRTGLAPTALEPGLTQALERGLLEHRDGRLAPSVRGFDFLSDLQQLFLAPSRGRSL